MSRVAKLIEEIKQLPKEELAELRAEIEELDADVVPLHPAWPDELARRVRSLKDGTTSLHDWEEVERELEAIIDR